MEKLSTKKLVLEIINQSATPLRNSDVIRLFHSKGYIERCSATDLGADVLGSNLATLANEGKIQKIDCIQGRSKYAYARLGWQPTATQEPAPPPPKMEAPKPPPEKKLEKEYHPVLNAFAREHLKVYCKTINANRSQARSSEVSREWFHPDMIGVFFYFGNFDTNVAKLMKDVEETPARFFSFELKQELTKTNLRESFFQAVSNSSWANEGYLVAGSISDTDAFRNELSRLNSAYGIGIITLEPTPTVLYPAKVKESLDWSTLDSLTRENKDVADLLKTISDSITITKPQTDGFDAL